MSNKAIKLNEANQRLTELINELQEREREYDKALEHSANYLGNDERIEQGRDARAQALLESVSVSVHQAPIDRKSVTLST